MLAKWRKDLPVQREVEIEILIENCVPLFPDHSLGSSHNLVYFFGGVLLDDMGIISAQYGINIATNEIKETDDSVPQ